MRKLRLLLIALVALNFLIGIQLAVVLWQLRPSLGKPIGSLPSVLQKVIPAVVTLRVTGQKTLPVEIQPRLANGGLNPVGASNKELFRTGGSGVIVDAKRGYLLTNNHVVENATDINVGLSDGRRLPARLVGQDAGTDLALLKVEDQSLPSIAIGNSDRARVGDVVVAVGNPFGLEGTATMGIISAVMRTEIGHEPFEDYFQIDAQINRGNSGGALVNARGQLIGINTVIAGGRGQGYSIGFAIPINMAMNIQAEIIKHGRMRRGVTGLIVKDLPLEQAPAGVNAGAVVEQVLPNTSAAVQRLKAGDIVLQAANKPVRNAAEFMTRVSMIPIGSKLPIVVYSDGKRKRVSLTVSSAVLEAPRKVLRTQLGSISGLVVGDILPGNPLYGVARGAQVLETPPETPSFGTGLVAGDVIVAIDGDKLVSADELIRLVEKAGLQYRLDVIRNGVPAWVRMSR